MASKKTGDKQGKARARRATKATKPSGATATRAARPASKAAQPAAKAPPKAAKPPAPPREAPAKTKPPASATKSPPSPPQAGAPEPARTAQAGRAAAGLPPPDWLRVEGSGGERRRFQRLPREMKVRLFAGGGAQTYLECNLRSVDVSLSGVFLRSTFFLPEGSPVRLEIDVTGDRIAEATGHVARVKREGEVTGFAIQFDGLGEDALRDLVCLFVGGRIDAFVQDFHKRHRGADPALLWEGILAWELERLSLALDGEE